MFTSWGQNMGAGRPACQKWIFCLVLGRHPVSGLDETVAEDDRPAGAALPLAASVVIVLIVRFLFGPLGRIRAIPLT